MCILHADQIALSSGCAVAPHRIEMRIRRELPFLSNVVVVGENQKFLSCLITLKVKSFVPFKVSRITLLIDFQYLVKAKLYSTTDAWSRQYLRCMQM